MRVQIGCENLYWWRKLFRYEKFNKADKSGEYTVIVGNRFMVEVEGTGVDMATMKNAVDRVDLAKLESMKDVGTKK